MKFDFSGYVTKNDLKCSDGRVIRHGAFADCDGDKVPLVWQHMHNDASNVLGHVLLENRDDGVYGYASFNETPAAQNGKELVAHGDITAMSIYANNLVHQGHDVTHGRIREVSLVLSGANPGAVIDTIAIQHSDGFVEENEDEAIITTGETLELSHADDDPDDDTDKDDDLTIQDVVDTMNDQQKDVLVYLVDQALGKKGDEMQQSEESEEETLKKNVFDGTNNEAATATLSHSQIEAIFKEAPQYGTLSESVMAHANNYGIKDIETLFPDAKELNNPPEFLQKQRPWVQKVLGGTHHTPFAKVKTTFADLSGDKSPDKIAEEARARGYKKGNLKKEEVFSLLRREHSPQTIYKKQKLDRDDILDITDFDVVVWIKAEMRRMLDEELARAILIGDGRSAVSEDKIEETHIRSILNDDELYSIKSTADKDVSMTGEELVDFIKLSMLDFEGSGTPSLFMHKRTVFDMLQAKDKMGRKLWSSRSELANELEVSEIIDVPYMKGLKRSTDSAENNVFGIVVDLSDYNIGTNRGGEVNFFDDFDLDYNQYKYLFETRLSGALIKPWSAVVIEQATE